MVTLKIESAALQDYESISLVLLQAFDEFRELYTKAAFDATVIRPETVMKRMQEGPVWVARLDGNIAGTVSLQLFKNEAYLRGMAVLPQAQGFKLGLSLLREAENFAIKNGSRLFLKTTPYLKNAIRLYEQFGFIRLQKETGDFYGTPIFTMEKIYSK